MTTNYWTLHSGEKPGSGISLQYWSLPYAQEMKGTKQKEGISFNLFFFSISGAQSLSIMNTFFLCILNGFIGIHNSTYAGMETTESSCFHFPACGALKALLLG